MVDSCDFQSLYPCGNILAFWGKTHSQLAETKDNQPQTSFSTHTVAAKNHNYFFNCSSAPRRPCSVITADFKVTPQYSPNMLLSVLTLTRVLSPPTKQATGRMQGTSKPLQYSPEALRGSGEAKESKDKRQIFFFKYIKMDTIGLYIHIHLTKPGEKGKRRAI